MKIAICDDEERIQNCLNQQIRTYFVNQHLTLNKIECFQDPAALLKAITSKNYFDIIFLDIEMPKMTGIECATQIRKKLKETMIIFVTGYNHYMPEAFSVEAFDFIEKEKLCKKLPGVLDRCLKKYQYLHQEVLFSANKQHLSLYPKEIAYIESHLKKVTFYMVSGEKHELTYKLRDCEKQLRNFNFSRCRLSSIVNLEYVKEINKKEIFLKVTIPDNKVPIPIGGRYYDSFMEDFLFYKTRQGVSK